MSKPKLKPSEVRKPLPIRFTIKEKRLLTTLAVEWTNGNVSAWVRIASLTYRPSVADLEVFIAKNTKKK